MPLYVGAFDWMSVRFSRAMHLLLIVLLNTLMALGMIAWHRALLMSDGTLPDTIAYIEAEHAAGFAALLCILTTPWLIIAAIVLY
jgi:hypothetical protein